MFLKNKKGSEYIVLQFVVLVIIAGIMILVVTSFGSKIWGALFGNEDKSSLKSFETLYSVISAKSVSQGDYDSTYITLYMAKNYRVVLFNGESEGCIKLRVIPGIIGPPQISASSTPYYAPKGCDIAKQCLCLYDDKPEYGEKDKNKNVVLCHVIPNKIEINYSLFDLNNHVCDGTTRPDYTPYIVIQRKEGTTEDSRRLYILEDTDDNRKLEDAWNIPICPNGPTEICYGVGQGKKIAPTDEEGLKKVYDACQTQKSISGTCIFDKTINKCKVECDDITSTCQKYSTCDSLNTNGNTIRYISSETNRVNYKLCSDHKTYCNSDCKINSFEAYIFKHSDNGEYKTVALPSAPTGCFDDYLIYNEYLLNGKQTYTNFVTHYNSSDQTCKDYFDMYFYPDKHPFYVCKKDNDACKEYINNNIDFCELKYFNEGSINFLTYFDSRCQTEIDKLFEKASYCVKTASTP